MKLAEALADRSDCQKKIEKLKERLVSCARVQEGEKPVEDPNALLAELRAAHLTLADLATRVNRTNAMTAFEPGVTLSDALAQRDHFMALRASLARVVEAASIRADRMTRSEVKYVSTIAVRELQAEVDSLAQAHRKLDSRIQEFNWATELLS